MLKSALQQIVAYAAKTAVIPDSGVFRSVIGNTANRRLVKTHDRCLVVTPGAGPASTPLLTSAPPGVDGRPAPAMTMKIRSRSVSSNLRCAVAPSASPDQYHL